MFGVWKGRAVAEGNGRVFIFLRKISVFVRMAVKNPPEDLPFFSRLAEDALEFERLDQIRAAVGLLVFASLE